jgi:hypothetical protein
MGCEWDGYENAGYRGEDYIKLDTWTGGRAKNTENRK